MIKKWLTWLNLGLAALVGLFLLFAGLIYLMRPSTIEPIKPEEIRFKVPQHAFEQKPEQYSQLNPGLLQIKTTSPAVQLPNLKNILNYFGRNNRPDANPNESVMHFNFTGSKETASIEPGKKLYIAYDRTTTPPRFLFSPYNVKTPIWLEAQIQGNAANVNLFMENENGLLIRKPAANAQFILPEKEFGRFGGNNWEMGKWRVDGTLFARQKARWFGEDLFLSKHGGEEYSFAKGKQRIDFGEGDEAYYVFIGENSCLAWINDRWQQVTPGPDTQKYPLLCLKKVDNRLMAFDLWDVNGRGRISLNLLKSIDAPLQKNLQQTLKFLGARTLSQFLFELNNERILLRPNDWLIFLDNKWLVLKDPESIQKYVDRKLIGPLFILGGVSRKDDRQSLKGTLFNATRTEAVEIEIPLVQAAAPANAKKESKGKKKAPATPAPAVQPPNMPNGERAANMAAPRTKAETNDDNQYDDEDDDDSDD